MIDWQAIIKEHGPALWQTAYRLLGNHRDAADCFRGTFVSALELSRPRQVRSFGSLLVLMATAGADRPATSQISSIGLQRSP